MKRPTSRDSTIDRAAQRAHAAPPCSAEPYDCAGSGDRFASTFRRSIGSSPSSRSSIGYSVSQNVLDQRRDQLQAVGQAGQAAVGELGAREPGGDAQILGLAQQRSVAMLADLAPVRLLGADQFLRRRIDRAGRAGGEPLELGDVGVFQVRSLPAALSSMGRERASMSITVRVLQWLGAVAIQGRRRSV